MAMASTQPTSPIRTIPGQCSLSPAIYPQSSSCIPEEIEPVVREWTASFNRALQSKEFHLFTNLFFKNSYWRDQLCLSWDYHTIYGPEGMKSFLERHPKSCRLRHLSINDGDRSHMPKMTPVDHNREVLGIQVFFNLETDVGNGKGLARLLQDEKSGDWKAFTLFTALYELRDHGETVKYRRPSGYDHTVFGQLREHKDWRGSRNIQEDFQENSGPTVLIIGARSPCIFHFCRPLSQSCYLP